MTAHPRQPVEMVDGVERFRGNAIVKYLLAHGGIDLNTLSLLPFEDDDRMQFAQLIGYSVDGYLSLPYVSDEERTAVDGLSAEPEKIALRIGCAVWREKDMSVHVNAVGWIGSGGQEPDDAMLTMAAEPAMFPIGPEARYIISALVDVPAAPAVVEVDGRVETAERGEP